MKRVYGILCFVGAFALPLLSFAQDDPAMTPSSGVKYIKLTIGQLKVWPVKPSGKCWDPCFGKKYKMPKRDQSGYLNFFKQKNFRIACSGRKAPDPYIRIRIGKYEEFVTVKRDNQCQPTFNISHVYRVSHEDSFEISVFDHDPIIKIPVNRDLIGHWKSSVIPPQLLNGGTLKLARFGQVEELTISAETVHPKVSPGCEGVYRVRIAEFQVKDTKENGKKWDSGLSKFKNPDVVVSLKIGNVHLKTPKKQDTLKHIFFKGSKTIPIKKRASVMLTVYDQDMFGRREIIGQTAAVDICKLLNPQGLYSFSGFGRVVRVVLLFKKLK